MIQTASVGGYPKTLHGQLLRKTLHAADRNPGKRGELERVIAELTREAIEEQLGLGLNWVTDGGMRRLDEITYFCEPLSGVKPGGLLRYFDTNTYFRQPIVAAAPKFREPFLSRDFAAAHPWAEDRLQLVVTGPVTLAALSKNQARLSLAGLAQAYAEAINKELRRVEGSAGRLLVLEPMLLQLPEKAALFKKVLRILLGRCRFETVVYVYFGDAARGWRALVDLETAGVGFDFTYTPSGAGLLEKRWDKGKIFYAGAVDARNTKQETAKELYPVFKRLARRVAPGKLVVTPSANLEYLPLDRCRSKLKNLARLAREFSP